MDIADLLDTDRHDGLLGLRLKTRVRIITGQGERQTQYWLNNTDFVMLNDNRKSIEEK